MLLPNERNQAIDILVRVYSASSSNNYNAFNGTTEIQAILRNGHKGFASYTDFKLMRALNALAKKTNSHEVTTFIGNIAAEKFMLE